MMKESEGKFVKVIMKKGECVKMNINVDNNYNDGNNDHQDDDVKRKLIQE